MLKPVLIFKSYFFFLMLSLFLTFFTSSGVISYGLLIYSCVMIFLYFVVGQFHLKNNEWLIIFIYFSFTSLGLFYYYINPYEGYVISQYTVFLLSFPFSVICLICLERYLNYEEFCNFINKLVVFFALGQLLVTVGQFSRYLYGFNFKVTEEYQNIMMISGTFFNSNDLSVVVVLIAFIYKFTSKFQPKWLNLIIWMILAYLLLVTGSRSCLFLFALILMSMGQFTYRKILAISSLIFAIVMLMVLFGNLVVDVDHPFYRIVYRINSINMMITDGVGSDESVSDRSSFYMYFIHHIQDIGIGSISIGNYFKYANHSYHFSPLFFSNPHAFIIEIAYWMGWSGLIIYLVLYFMMVLKSKLNLLFVLISFSTLFVSSSLMGNMVYFLLVAMASWICYLSSNQVLKLDSKVL